MFAEKRKDIRPEARAERDRVDTIRLGGYDDRANFH